jgi:hypothetical protein
MHATLGTAFHMIGKKYSPLSYNFLARQETGLLFLLFYP